MLVHANPMVQHKSGIWEDSCLGRVMVKSFMVNWGNHRKRWGVFERRRRSGPAALVSKHITEAQAVVLTQRLANRLYRQSKEKKPREQKHVGSRHSHLSNRRSSVPVLH